MLGHDKGVSKGVKVYRATLSASAMLAQVLAAMPESSAVDRLNARSAVKAAGGDGDKAIALLADAATPAATARRTQGPDKPGAASGGGRVVRVSGAPADVTPRSEVSRVTDDDGGAGADEDHWAGGGEEEDVALDGDAGFGEEGADAWGGVDAASDASGDGADFDWGK